MARQTGSPQPEDEGEQPDDGAGRIARAAAAGRSRLVADANLIDALVRIDELEVATRAIAEQRADLVSYAIDLREAVADAVESRDAPAEPGGVAPEAP